MSVFSVVESMLSFRVSDFQVTQKGIDCAKLLQLDTDRIASGHRAVMHCPRDIALKLFFGNYFDKAGWERLAWDDYLLEEPMVQGSTADTGKCILIAVPRCNRCVPVNEVKLP